MYCNGLLYGLFVVFRLGRNVFGRVMICNISDRYIKNYESAISVGSLVRAKVLRYSHYSMPDSAVYGVS